MATNDHALIHDMTFIASHDGTQQRYVRRLHAGFDATTACDALVALHGHGSDRWQFVKDPRDECRAARDAATEYGMVNLKGKSTRERALDIISLAHPKFRDDLIKEAENMYLL